jgi:hypothetical protein
MITHPFLYADLTSGFGLCLNLFEGLHYITLGLVVKNSLLDEFGAAPMDVPSAA